MTLPYTNVPLFTESNYPSTILTHHKKSVSTSNTSPINKLLPQQLYRCSGSCSFVQILTYTGVQMGGWGRGTFSIVKKKEVNISIKNFKGVNIKRNQRREGVTE